MLSPKYAYIIADFFYQIDASVRHDLINRMIANEPDYVSRLITHFSYPFGILNRITIENIKFQSTFFSKVLDKRTEKKFGCDAMIAFRVGSQIKIGLFEAKWPRISDPDYSWDSVEKKSKKSHFTSQIQRQQQWSDTAAIWEMFFNELPRWPIVAPFDSDASSCVWHDTASSFIELRDEKEIWDNDDLTALLEVAKVDKVPAELQTNLRMIIADILMCNVGQTIPVNEKTNTFTITNKDGDTTFNINIPTFQSDSNQINDYFDTFLNKTGLSSFIFTNIEISDNKPVSILK